MYDPTTLASRTVLITGASSGIGEACAWAFARAGARLILCARRPDRLDNVVKGIRKEFGAEIHSIQLDVRDREAVAAAIDSLPQEWSEIDVLVNNAGLSRGLEPIQEGSIDDWEEMIDTNVKGLLYVSRAVIPGMVARGRGHVINIGSIAGHEVYPKGNVYCASKHAVDAITKGMLLDLNGTGVKVTTVDPGLVETEFSIVRFHGDNERAGNVYKGLVPLGGTDVADAVLYCATLPPHVNVAEMVLLPTAQASATVVHRQN